MNDHTLVRMRTVFGTDEGNEELGERHVALKDIPAELTWQAHRCRLNGNIKVVKLTIVPEVEQPLVEQPPVEPEEPEFYPMYGAPDLSPFYDEL
ncbi:MAG: hypothetical protein JO161_05500 [Planctomycetaceae bacterium]|nr:hypothetical protein [Planctomycetaceae bacterium]